MQLQGKAVRVTIYIGESDHHEGKSLYMAILNFLKKEGASGATVLRGLAGFGAHSRIHTATLVDLSSDLPIRVEWIDQRDRVERLLPQLRHMVNDGLITVEEVDVAQYAPGRRPDPLAQPVRDVMRTVVVSVLPQTSAAEIVTLLLQKGYRSLPVVDENGRLQGIITDGDLLRRTQLAARLDLQVTTNWQQQLAALRDEGQTAATLMSQPVITITANAPLRQAVQQMVNHNLKRLPVVDGNGRLVGWISRVDILHQMEYHQPVMAVDQEAPSPGQTIRDLMYQEVPTVPPQATLEEVLRALEKNRRRRVVVVNDTRQVLGIITDGDLLRRSHQGSHPGLMARLRRLVTGEPDDAPWPALVLAHETAADLMTTPAITITADAAPAGALQLMVQHKVKRLPVVDENGRLVGLLGRASLLRGLMGEASS